MTSLETLLDVQAHDTAIVQLHHRRQHLPERAELAAGQARLAAIDTETAPLRAQAQAADQRQQALDDELHTVERKLADVERKLFDGSVSAPRELQALEADRKSLTARKGELEDLEIEQLMAREPLDAQLAASVAEQAALRERGAALAAAIAAAEAVVDAEAATHIRARQELAGGLPASLLAAYDAQRKHTGDVGAARLEHGSCSACHLKLPPVELERIRKEPPDAVIRCEQCAAILVR